MADSNVKINPVSLAEIAEMLGVTRQKVASLNFHGKLPEPAKRIKACPLWDKEEIEDFIFTVGFNDRRRKDEEKRTTNTTK